VTQARAPNESLTICLGFGLSGLSIGKWVTKMLLVVDANATFVHRGYMFLQLVVQQSFGLSSCLNESHDVAVT